MAFLHSCIRENLPLKSLRKKPIVDSFECQQAIHQFQRRTTRALINDQHRRVRVLTQWVHDCQTQCEAMLSRDHFQALARHIGMMEQRTRQETSTRLQCKVNVLREFKCKHGAMDGLVRNLSSKVLTQAQLALLQRDIGHNLMDANALDFISALEPTMCRMGADEDVKSSIRQQITGLLTNHTYQHTLSREENMALGQLKRDSSIVILPADKGRVTVVMDKAMYTTKALELLNDRTAYRVVEKDPSVMLRNKVNKLLDSLKRSNKIGDDTLRKIRPCDTALARFYGLPKIHKEGIPLRPIISFAGTPISGLAKWLSIRLSHLVEGSPMTVRSAEEFLDGIKTLRLEDNEKMVSFDVTSLFTSIPQDLAISALSERLMNTQGHSHQDSLGKEDLLRLVRICLTTYFTFQGTIYEQIKGTPMGSPISSIIAEVVLQQLEHKAMAIYQPKFWVRYVDDTFAVVKKQHVATFMGTLNSICSDIQFTVEEEKQGHLAFLDVSVRRQQDGQLHTGVFRKSTHTDRILHYRSNHPMSHKVSCIKTLFKRVDSHCSTEELKREERKHLSRVFLRNGYPWRFIRQYNFRPCPRVNRRREEPSTQKTRVTLPYIHNVSEATARLLSPYGIEVAHRPNQTLRSKIVRPKDPLVAMDKSAVIYKINCQNCDGNYVGETSKRLGTRIHEHKLAIKRGEQHSQLWMHMARYDHQFDFANACVISEEATKGGRLLKEAWYSDKDSINRHIDLHPAQQALRRWDLNRRINQHRRPLQYPHDHNVGVSPSPHSPRKCGTRIDPQHTQTNPVTSDQRLHHPGEQLEFLIPANVCNHLSTNDPPPYPLNGPPPRECDEDCCKPDRTSSRCLRSHVAACSYGHGKKGGEKGKDEGTTGKPIGAVTKRREIIPHLKPSKVKRTCMDSMPPSPWNRKGCSGTNVEDGDGERLPRATDAGGGTCNHLLTNFPPLHSLDEPPHRSCGDDCRGPEGATKGLLRSNVTVYEDGVVKKWGEEKKGEGTMCKLADAVKKGKRVVLHPDSLKGKHTYVNGPAPSPQDGCLEAIVIDGDDQHCPRAVNTGGGEDTSIGTCKRHDHQRAAHNCDYVFTREREGEIDGARTSIPPHRKLTKPRRKTGEGRGQTDPPVDNPPANTIGSNRELDVKEVKQGDNITSQSIKTWNGNRDPLEGGIDNRRVIDTPKTSGTTMNRTNARGGKEDMRTSKKISISKDTVKATTRKGRGGNEGTSEIRANRPGPVTRSMSRVQMSVKPI